MAYYSVLLYYTTYSVIDPGLNHESLSFPKLL